MVIGIDPGSTTGIAVVHKGVLIYVEQFTRKESIDAARAIAATYMVKKAIIEKPRLGILYARHDKAADGKGADAFEAIRIKIAMNVGECIAHTKRIEEALTGDGVRCIMVNPKKGGKGGKLGSTKWPSNIWAATFNWGKTRLPGQHARDAAIIAYIYDGL